MGRFGMTTGRSYCGISGSPKRMEYTVQGDVVYLSAWLMAKSPRSARSAQGQGQGQPSGNFEPQPRPPSVSIGVTLKQRSALRGTVTSSTVRHYRVRRSWSNEGLLRSSRIRSCSEAPLTRRCEQSLQVGTAVARSPTGSPFAEGGVVVMRVSLAWGR